MVACVHTGSSGADHMYPCAGESAPGSQVDELRKGAPQSLARWAPLRCLDEP